MKIQVGKTYRTRDGQTVTIDEFDDELGWPFRGNLLTQTGYKHGWAETGKWREEDEEMGLDIVSEVISLKVGYRYRTRDGEIVKIVKYDRDRGANWPFIGEDADTDGLHYNSWSPDGFLFGPLEKQGLDLVEELGEDSQWTAEQLAAMDPDAPPLQINTIRCLLPEDSSARKGIPVTTGVLDYFPLAIAAVAELSKLGNDKHNPGEPLHWARGKSTDHADCIGRHLIDRGRFAEDGTRHTAALAWRALAMLQEELENEAGIGPVSR